MFICSISSSEITTRFRVVYNIRRLNLFSFLAIIETLNKTPRQPRLHRALDYENTLYSDHSIFLQDKLNSKKSLNLHLINELYLKF